MRKILAVMGRPGTGKTTLFRKFLEGKEWENQVPIKLLPTMYNKELDLHILGKYEDGNVFAGTDTLAMNVMPNATEFIKNTTSNIMFEGDRLTSQKFFELANSLSDVEFKIILLDTYEDLLYNRYKERGSNQSETFLKGRVTKIGNIVSNMELMFVMDHYFNNTFEDQEKILNEINKFLGI